MSRLMVCIEDTVKVDGYQFMLVDLDGAPGQPEGAVSFSDLVEASGPASWFVTTANLAIVTSAHHRHVAAVALELWDGRPPADEAEWTKDVTSRLYSSSGRVRLAQILGRPSVNVMNLGRRGGTWTVRACLRPGPGVRETAEKPLEGLESFRLQFWPSTD